VIAIAVHGGAGGWPEPERAQALGGVERAAAAGWAQLAGGGSALDAVTAAVVALEDDPLFNAGTGSVLNAAGEVEMDASVMSGEDLACGGVACLRRVRNPVLVARRVMEATDCVLLAGPLATAFAREQGFPDHDPVTERRRTQWESALARGARPAGDGNSPSTVGAVALDDAGRLAAATSTGGRELKRPGRVGDSPVPGAGNYATREAAVSATGSGEAILRAAMAKTVADRVASGIDAPGAAAEVLREMTRRFDLPLGVICLDRQGRIGIAHSAIAMPHALRRTGDAQVTARFRLAPAR
jgi:beta-aspartyl-peptidase (threonine type)